MLTDSESLFDQMKLPWVTSGEAISDLDSPEYDEHLAGHFAGGNITSYKQIPEGDNYLYFTGERGHPNPKFEWRSRYWSFLLKLSHDRPWTIQTPRSNNQGPLHWRNRILRIEELKRLQSFPDDWALAGAVLDQWHQIGNAVPPPLGYQLAKAVLAAATREDLAA